MNTYTKTIINPGDAASQIAKEVAFESHENCDAVNIYPKSGNHFRAGVDFLWKPHVLQDMFEGKTRMTVENDGAGGKPQFFTFIGTEEVFVNLGWEIIAMTADDIACKGGLPCIIANELNLRHLTPQNMHLYATLMRGYGSALKAARLVNITGETAVMQHSVTAFCDTGAPEQLTLTWGGTCIGLTRTDRTIDASRIEPGMPIIGLHERGYRCNGGTFLTNLIRHRWGQSAQALTHNVEAKQFVRKLATPSVLYTPLVTHLLGWTPDGRVSDPIANVYGAAHITGGGVYAKLAEALPDGIGAELDNFPDPPEVLVEAQRLSQHTSDPLTDQEAYRVFHGRCGMLLVTDHLSTERIIKTAQQFGIGAQIIGYTIRDQEKQIHIHSRFLGKEIVTG